MTDAKGTPAVQVTATAFAALFSVVGLALYGLPLYYDFMVREFGWSRTMVTSGNALSKLVVGPIFGFAAGWIVDRFGPRRLMMAGIVMAGGALIGLGTVSALWMFYFFYFFNALGYVCGGPLPNQVLLSRWFDATRGRAMGIAYLGIGIGGALVPLLANRLTQQFGWRGSLQAVGVLIILIALPLAYFVKEAPHAGPERAGLRTPDAHAGSGTTGLRQRGRRDARGAALSGPPSEALRPILTSPAFYLLALGSMCSIAAVGGANQHLKLFLSLDRGYSQSDAAQVISLVLAVSIAGRLLMGWLADRAPRKQVMLLIYVLVACSIPLLLAGGSRLTMYVFAIVFGLGLGGEYMIIPLMAAELFGVRVLGRVMGIVLTADGVAEATAPMLVGYLRDRSSSYATGFITLVAAALVGAIAIALLPRRRGARESGFGIRDSGFGSVDSALGTPDSTESRIPNPKSL
jgi:sugar phosphate permease